MANTKLELTWIGKDKQPKLEPRILIEDPDKSYGDRNTDNMLIFGDNLLALKALEQEFTGRIKCIFIDPPYNTGSAFAQYDDGIEHSLWLTLMRDRLIILHRLLAEGGSIWITIDDNESHYLKVLCDEVFGRGNFISTLAWQKKYAVKSDSEFFSESHDFILVYAKDRKKFILGRFGRTESQDARYKNPDDDPRGNWTSGPLQRNEARDYAIFPIVSRTGKEHLPPKGTSWRFTKEKMAELIADNRIWFGESGNNVPRLKRFLTEVSDSVPATTWWDYQNFGHNDEGRREAKALAHTEDMFATPKPERLISKIVELATLPSDIILDSFGGSGTTGAVAHKMDRKWIMVELGDHCYTHIQPRMQKVCDGTDQGGISKVVNWQGGGGFKYYYMAPSLLKKDRYDQWIINEEYNPTMLAAAMAKHESFRYCPDEVYYWKQGQSSEKDFIFTTTAHLTPEHLDRIHEEMQPDDGLLICCKSHFEGADGKYSNITVKKIPSMLLGKCEFDRDDYSLNIVDMPRNPDDPVFVPTGPKAEEKKEEKESKAEKAGQMNIFAGTGD
jgi:adenine-specific DNA-methyltransferase